MFRFATVLVLIASALVVGQTARRSQRDVPIAAQAAQAVPGASSVPQQINHQGLVTVNGVRFNGTGLFKFAIVDPDTGINLWCNDDNDPAGPPADPQNCVGQQLAVPTASVGLDVTDGVYSVALGDLTRMKPIPSSVFNDNNAVLRIWFNDGVNGRQRLEPDQKLTAAPYSHRAAGGIPVGTVMMWAGSRLQALPTGWFECDGMPLNKVQFPELFAVIQTLHGGDGNPMFNLPHFSNRSPMGADGQMISGRATTSVSGQALTGGGTPTHILTIAEMPSHRHGPPTESGISAYYSNRAGFPAFQGGTTFNADGRAFDTGPKGNDQPHNNLHPYFAITYIIYTGREENTP